VPSPDYSQRLAELLARMPSSSLLNLRANVPSGSPTQELLAPYEHRAFAREEVGRNPLMALPISAAIPAYQGWKALGQGGARTPPSLEQLLQGYLGVKEGLSGQ
jgi:hypothetical protein